MLVGTHTEKYRHMNVFARCTVTGALEMATAHSSGIKPSLFAREQPTPDAFHYNPHKQPHAKYRDFKATAAQASHKLLLVITERAPSLLRNRKKAADMRSSDRQHFKHIVNDLS